MIAFVNEVRKDAGQIGSSEARSNTCARLGDQPGKLPFQVIAIVIPIELHATRPMDERMRFDAIERVMHYW